jgi:hypothetical protein
MPYVAAALLALAGAVLAGCETTAEKSARLERAAQRRGGGAAAKGLQITHPSSTLKVTDAALVGGSEGAAAVVTIRNTARQAVHDVPIALTVKDPSGATAYTNTTPGLARTLVYVPYIAGGSEAFWVDDQLPPQAAHGTVAATVGQAPALIRPAPLLVVSGAHTYEDPTNGLGEEGTVSNRSSVTQEGLVIFAVARTGHGVAAAGRAVLPQLGAGASTRFQVFWVGNPAGARVEIAAPPSTVR